MIIQRNILMMKSSIWSLSLIHIYCDFAAREFDESFDLKVSKHSSDNFPVGTKMVGDSFVSDF